MRIKNKLPCLMAFMVFPVLADAPPGASPVAPSAGDKAVIDARKHIMNTMKDQSNTLGDMMAGLKPDDDAVALMDALAQTASGALKAFEPQVQGGESKPEVWTQWADFSKRMNEFMRKTAEMSKIAHDKGKQAGLEDTADALTCKGCHDVYRTGVDTDE